MKHLGCRPWEFRNRVALAGLRFAASLAVGP